jgi:KpsF/GutQ family protein/YrbI family 3-deoxy-D-manno-octulosonate 8-phosphate phosphatase
MGKSGHIAGKIAATLASTGTPSFFMHAAEASHGDIGMITREDALFAISNSGETPEVLLLIPHASRLGVPLIAVTGNPKSSLARAASVHLDVSVAEEACPLNLAPTASTTVTLALGDALAVALLEARGFTSQDFARSHPGGALGRKLLLHVADVMRSGDELPVVSPDARLAEGLLVMSKKGLGMCVVTEGGRMLGVFTDGDLRRTLDRRIDVHLTSMREVMISPENQCGRRSSLPRRRISWKSTASPPCRCGCRRDTGWRAQRPRPAARRGAVSDVASFLPALRRVQLLVLDVDGVLTDGRLSTAHAGIVQVFSCSRRHGIKQVAAAGITVAIISGRKSAAVALRARELGIRHVTQGANDKLAALEKLARARSVALEHCACVGDDTPDAPMMQVAGLAIAVADAHVDALAVPTS